MNRSVRLLTVTLALFVCPEIPAEEVAKGPGHKEVPVEPPPAPLVAEEPLTSPAAIVTRGNHVSVQVNIDALGDNILNDAANEPSIAIDPTDPSNIVIGWRQFDSISSSFRQAGYAYSHDGGMTWTHPGVLDPGQFRSDPVLDTDSLGNFFYYSLSSTTSCEMFISGDKGVTWQGPIPALGGDKNWMTIDATGGIGNDHVYPLWNSQFTCCAPGTDISRSTDGGQTYEGPFVLPQHPKWGTADVGPDGELYVAGSTLSQSSHLILKSTNAEDAGATPTFTSTGVALGGTTDTGGTPNPGGLMGQVWVATDRSTGSTRGNVYMLASVNPPGSDPLDVHIVRSVDGGQTFGAPVRVNDDPPGTDAYQWFGTMSVAPDGRIDVVWNDTRNDPTGETSELYYAYSTDGGDSWSAGLPVSPAFNSLLGHPQQNKIGDYYDMVSDGAGAAVAYSATFNGEQDVYFLRVGDCNQNGSHDSVDIADLSSEDCNGDGIPDECEPDCNGNDIADGCDLESGTSVDCNANRVPDECEPDCNGNSVADDCDLDSGSSADCNDNRIPDECDIAGGAEDCNGDGVIDECNVLFDLETDQGFTVGAPDDNATGGIWVRVDPNGTIAAPENDHTPDAGVQCYVTGQGSPGGPLREADVDGGKTTLFSPTLDLSGSGDPNLGYWRWYNGGGVLGDAFVVDISDDGGQSWTNVETLAPDNPEASGGWFFHIFRVADVVTPTADVVVRFVAADFGGPSVVEAAIDDVVLVDCACAVPIPGEPGNLLLGLSSPTVADLSWDAEANAATYDVYRGTERDASDLACFETGLATTSTSDDGFVGPPGEPLLYLVTAANCAGTSSLGPGRVALDPCP